MSRVQPSTLSGLITEFYEVAEVPYPTAQRCVTPLAELIESTNVSYVERPNLTSRGATDYLLQNGGLIEPLEEANDDPLAGFLYATTNFGVIFVDRSDLLVRRRFSAAHELGHYLIHFRPLLTALDANGEPVLPEALDALSRFESEPMPDDLPTGQSLVIHATSVSEFERREREANRFAVELLMPESIVRELAAQYETDFQGDDLVWRMATEMLVSGATMGWRLRNLGLLSP